MRGWLRRLFLDTWHEFRARWREYLLFTLFFEALVVLLLGPAVNGLFGYLISNEDSTVVSNEDLARFFLSPWGVLVLVLAGGVWLAVQFAKHAGQVWIAGADLHGQKGTAYAAIVFVVTRGVRFLEFGLTQVVLGLLRLAPLIALAVLAFLLLTRDTDLNYLIVKRPAEFWYAVAILGTLGLAGAAVILILRIRWVFAMPIFLFEGRNPRAALKESHRLVKGSGPRVVGLFAAWWAGAALAFFGGLELLYLFGQAIVSFPSSVSGVLAVAGLLALLNIVFVAGVSFLAVTGESLLLVRLYRGLRKLTPPPASPEVPQRQGRVFVAGMTALVLLATAAVVPIVGDLAAVERHVEVTAHRGASGDAPENTLAALRRAIEIGADYSEIDVQEIADGSIVLFHDTDLKRLTGSKKKIWEVTLPEMKRFDLGRWFAPEFTGERVATLREAIDLVRGRMKLNIELKYHGHEQGLAERVVKIVGEERFRDECVLSSLNAAAVRRVRELDPGIRVGDIVFNAVGDLTRLDVDFLSVHTGLATESLVDRAHRQGVEVLVWTVNRADRMLFYIDLGVDNILTDEPALLRRLIAERESLSDQEKILLALHHWWKRG